uniref:Beta-ketoacyl-[acyl-carrier-protein] synthase III N-terminal domain-containing protein n=1 Tax=Proboscia inermis TaxID=420281 RepID=A0A7S0CJS0_9STRA|mmetsp:Transcript_5294/g.5524  ORF Transcript_5294/g.5524 Transcript_5294/m.5524 type:complete len:311 (+) Transcript_5294:140-1072(+)
MRMRSAILSVFLIGLVDGLAFTNGPSRTRFQKTALSMATSGALNCRPIGVGSAAPKTVVTNDDLENIVETNDEWISSRTGISQRRLLTHFNGEEGEEKENLVTISQEAAANALEMSGLDALDIDMVICCTSSPDDMFGDATSIAAGIGCKNAVAFDITAACSGFLFGSVTAGQFLHNKSIKNAIVVGADALSRWVDWDDRNSCILFGDGAGAVVYTASDEPGMLGYSAHSNGLGHDDLMLGYKGEKRMIATPGEGTELSSGSYDNISMNGREVYKFATREVPVVLKEALEAANMTVDDIDWLLLHQVSKQ